MRSDTLRARRRPISIRVLLTLGTGSLLLLATIIALSGYLSLRQLQFGVQTTLEEASRVRDLGLGMENEFLLARQEEANFLSRWRSIGFENAVADHVAAHHSHLTQAREQLDELKGLAQAASDPGLQALTAEIDTLPPLLDSYELAFQTTISQIQERSRTGGLESQLAKVLDELESLVAPLPEPVFRQRVLEMRVNEQAYLNTYRQEYVDNARLQLDQFTSLVDQSAQGSTASASGLVNKARSYYQLFKRLVSLDQDIDINTTIFQEVTTDINHTAGQIAAESEAGLARAQGRLRTVSRQSMLTLAITAALTLGLGLVAALVLSRRIIPPLRQLSQAAEDMGRGNLAQSVDVKGADELVTLATAFNTMASRLRQTLLGLEREVAERTRGLQAAAEVARVTASTLDPDELLRRTVELIRERLDLYYVGLFLLGEEAGEAGQRVAVLRAGTGEAGQQMMAQGHSLEVVGDSMIGQCVARGQASIALDVGTEAVHFDNPLLPDTRSEMALPLISRGQVIGAMTIQDTREAAFNEADIALMQTMADQVAVAIDNARLFAETETAFQELEAIHKHYMGRAWADYSRARAVRGYQQTDSGLAAVGDELLPEVRQAIAAQQPEKENGHSDADEHREQSSAPALVAPIMLRGQPIGALGLRQADGRRSWTEEEIEVVQTIAQEFALAADNIRLVEDTQRRAAQDRLVSEITGRLQGLLDPDSILKATVRELGLALNARVATVQITGPQGEGRRAPGSENGDGEHAKGS